MADYNFSVPLDWSGKTLPPGVQGENAAASGLGYAVAALQGQNKQYNYPSFVPSQTASPSQQSYFNYTPNAPMTKVQAPNYQLSAGNAPQYKGLMGGDYDALQQSLQKPGEISAQNAYNTGNRNLNNAMGGRGLYGSSIMAQQANEGLNREYMNALAANAANAAAQRYGMQATDLQNQNQFGLSARAQDLTRESDINKFGLQNFANQEQQNVDLWKAGLADSAAQNDYNQNRLQWQQQGINNMINWQNQQAYEQYQYELAKRAYEQNMAEQQINRALAIAGKGAPLAAASQQYQIQQQQNAIAQQAAAQAASAATTGAYMGAGGTALGGLLGSNGFWNTMGNWGRGGATGAVSSVG